MVPEGGGILKAFLGPAGSPLVQALGRAREWDRVLYWTHHTFQDGERVLHWGPAEGTEPGAFPSGFFAGVRSCTVVVPRGCGPLEQQMMDILRVLDCVDQAGAAAVQVCIPFMLWGRQSPSGALASWGRLVSCRWPRVVWSWVEGHTADMRTALPGSRNIRMAPVWAEVIAAENPGPVAVVAPDEGGVARARDVAQLLDAPLVQLEKIREGGQVTVQGQKGLPLCLAGRTCLLVDDILDSGATVQGAAVWLKARGAQAVWACVAHETQGKPVRDLSALDRLWLTDTTDRASRPLPPCIQPEIRYISVAPLLAKVLGAGFFATEPVDPCPA